MFAGIKAYWFIIKWVLIAAAVIGAIWAVHSWHASKVEAYGKAQYAAGVAAADAKWKAAINQGNTQHNVLVDNLKKQSQQLADEKDAQIKLLKDKLAQRPPVSNVAHTSKGTVLTCQQADVGKPIDVYLGPDFADMWNSAIDDATTAVKDDDDKELPIAIPVAPQTN